MATTRQPVQRQGIIDAHQPTTFEERRTSMRSTIILTTFVLCLHAIPALAQPEDDEFKPGLVGSYIDGRGDTHVSRVDRQIAFDWTDRDPDPRIKGRTFEVQWDGRMMSQARGDYRLHLFLAGWAEVELNGDKVIKAKSGEPTWHVSDLIPLSFGFHKLNVRFTDTADAAVIKLFWSGPQFQLEPLSERWLFHESDRSVNELYERGQALVRGLRCAACHEAAGPKPLAAPSLEQVAGNFHRDWLVKWLTNEVALPEGTIRRMPHFDLKRDEAESLAAFLIEQSKPTERMRFDKKKIDRKAGEQSLLTLGCLACHQVGSLGNSDLFTGGDLSQIATKRPVNFFQQWLAKPESLNKNHRMPVFELSKDERRNLAAHLQTLGKAAVEKQAAPTEGQVDLGRKLFLTHRCGACHVTAHPFLRLEPVALKQVDTAPQCLGEANRSKQQPGYGLSDEDRAAIRGFLAVGSKPAKPTGRQLLAENNCLACHQRGNAKGLAERLPAVAEAHSDLAPLLPAMTPPPLIGVGDKLHEAALKDAIARKSVYRDYLRVRMPKFNFSDDQLKTLVAHFVETDRVPDPKQAPQRKTTDPLVLHAVGKRLVTSDGFGCTSCHQVGSALPAKAPLNARGPTLSMLGDRIRRSWFDRFVRSPLRVIPRMEMPSVQVAVTGTLDDDLESQLTAVWDVLNTKGFEPPQPNPVRVVRRSGITERNERAVVLTDVIQIGKEQMLKPLLIGLPNRQNFLFDLQRGALVRWSVGDVARQRTAGKTWFWEIADTELGSTSEGVKFVGGEASEPSLRGQFITELDELTHIEGGVRFTYRLSAGSDTVRITETLRVLSATKSERVVEAERLDESFQLNFAVLRPGKAKSGEPLGTLQVLAPLDVQSDDGVILQGDKLGEAYGAFHYTASVPVDQFPIVAPVPPSPPALKLNAVPGFEVTRLPLSSEFMPTGLAWRPNGELIVASLKGRVWSLRDTNDDGLEDVARAISDELAAPYGVAAGEKHIDVVNKYGLMRLFDEDGDGHSERMVTAASGWGHTTDYHDWVVGLPKDKAGNYYVALPCQQDKRSLAAAKLRGSVLKLSPREPTKDDPSLFAIEVLTGGHRFPMGLARNKAGEMFVTDNQGNYNPFNELNHVVPGKRFGFINAVDRKPDFKPPLTPPAINIPHPWTRSVNGICFLESPDDDEKFGPFEGHLVGAEYDTRRLIRMSLHKVGNGYQGAAYPFSYDTPPTGPPFLGPLVCEVSPSGDLYVGGIRDSGWGGANNIGEIVRLRPDSETLPCGIAEVRATADGFAIDFTSPVDRAKASKLDSYSISSYTRISTPAYGGGDHDRRQEKIASVSVSDNARSAIVKPETMRAGFVYEIRLKSLAPDTAQFFPAEAHYTLRTALN